MVRIHSTQPSQVSPARRGCVADFRRVRIPAQTTDSSCGLVASPAVVLPGSSRPGDTHVTMARFLGCLFLLVSFVSAAAQDDLGSKAKDVFARRCVECHGSQVDPKKKSFK